MKNLIIALILTIVMLAGCSQPQQLAGVTSSSQVFVIPITPDYSVTTVADCYIVLYDNATGYLIDGDTGTPAIDTVWNAAGAAIECAAGDVTGAGTNVLTAVCTIPALDTGKQWVMMGFENSTPANTDALKFGPWAYDPATNRTYTETNPITDYQDKTSLKVREQ